MRLLGYNTIKWCIMNQLKKITKVKWSAILIFVIIIITLVYLFVPNPWANDDIRYVRGGGLKHGEHATKAKARFPFLDTDKA